MTQLLLSAVLGAVAGALTAALVSVVSARLRRRAVDPEPASGDPFLEAEIDQAAVAWARHQGRPDAAAGLMADKLKLLHRLGVDRGWH